MISKRKQAIFWNNFIRTGKIITVIIVVSVLVIAVAYSYWARMEWFKEIDERLAVEQELADLQKWADGELAEKDNELDVINLEIDSLTDQVRQAYYSIYVETLGYEMFNVTAYSPNDPEQGTTNLTSIEFDFDEPYMKFFNVCAVDPNVIPLGSIVYVILDGIQTIWLAGDIGWLVKGNHIDLFLTEEEAAKWETGLYPVKIIKPAGYANGE